MQTVTKSDKLNGVCYDIRGPVQRRAARLEEEGHVVTGQGVDPDVVTASARAYINGLNRLKFSQEMGPKLGKPEEL